MKALKSEIQIWKTEESSGIEFAIANKQGALNHKNICLL